MFTMAPRHALIQGMTTTPEPKGGDEPGPGSQSSLRQANETRVIDALRLGGATTQADLARQTALAPSTVSGIIRDLAEEGLVRVEEEHGGRRGRLVELRIEGRVLVGVDIGHAHVTVGLATLTNELLGTRYRVLEHPHKAPAVLGWARRMLDELLSDAGLGPEAVVAGGLSVPAPIDLSGHIIGSRQILPGWAGIHLASVAAEALGVHVDVDNDANAGALAEHRWGAGRGHDDMAYVKLGHGLGAGLVLRGELYRGATGVAGEFGHTIVDEQGAFCRCGNRGCLETVCNAHHLVGLLHHTHPHIDTVEKLVAAARDGDSACLRAIGDTGRVVGVSVANLCNLINPGVVVVGGALAAAGDLLLDPLRASVRRYGVPSAVEQLLILPSELGVNTHLLGAVSLAMWGVGPVSGRPAAFAR